MTTLPAYVRSTCFTCGDALRENERDYCRMCRADLSPGREKCRACGGQGFIVIADAAENGSGEWLREEDCSRCLGRGEVEECSQ